MVHHSVKLPKLVRILKLKVRIDWELEVFGVRGRNWLQDFMGKKNKQIKKVSCLVALLSFRW